MVQEPEHVPEDIEILEVKSDPDSEPGGFRFFPHTLWSLSVFSTSMVPTTKNHLLCTVVAESIPDDDNAMSWIRLIRFGIYIQLRQWL